MGIHGESVRIEFNSSDASTAAAITLWDANSVARLLAANERLMIDTIMIQSASALTTTDLFDDADADGNVDTGERLVSKNVATAVPIYITFGGEGMPCGLGRLPKMKANSSGVVVINGIGRIIKG